MAPVLSNEEFLPIQTLKILLQAQSCPLNRESYNPLIKKIIDEEFLKWSIHFFP